jgi:uncharacterized membrane protein
MKREEFLARLKSGLSGMPRDQVNDVVRDYESHFAEGMAQGRSEDDIAAALGDPARLAKELRAEAGLKRWQEGRNAASFIAALLAFLGLATFDVILLLPVLFVVLIVLFAIGIAMLALTIVGIVVEVMTLTSIETVRHTIAAAFQGAGLVAGGIGGGALLLLVLDWMVAVLGRYARMHYRLLKPAV